MVNYSSPQARQDIRERFRALYILSQPLNIVIVTYNRLPYLQKCIASIHGSTTMPYRILVLDDGSTDGTQDWLSNQHERGKVWKILFRKRVGTAENFNHGLELFKSEWVVVANDDMWFHRWWEYSCLYILNKEREAATLTFYDFTNHKVVKANFREYDRISASGLGAAFIRRKSWEQAGKFHLNKGRTMGFFASNFCAKIEKQADYKQHFITRPNWAHHMDLPTSRLSERDVLDDYIIFRKQAKKGASG